MYKILIVEDNQMNFELAAELLEYAGHSVIKSENLQQCLDVIGFEKPDLILMDINLPDIKGTEITKILKNNPDTRDIVIVAYTAMAMEKDKEECFKSGCSGFISKPIDVPSFVSTVEKFARVGKKNINLTAREKKSQHKKNKPKSNNINLETKSNKRHNILVVDDNVMNADILKETLEQLGKDVKIANNGQSAFEIIEKEKFDLVLLDIMMPDISGFDVIKKFKANPKTADVPVIFVSALDKTSDIVKGFDLGSHEYIVKPYKIEELKARVLSILKIKDLQDQLKSEKKILDLIFEFSEDGIVLLNSEFEIISCNKKFVEWVGKQKEEIINMPFCEIVRCERKNCFQDFCASESYFDFEIDMNQDEKINSSSSSCLISEKRFIEANCSKISISKENEKGGYVMVLRDVTVKKEIEAQKETFVATLTHDLKTPVRAQIKALELLLDGKMGDISSTQAELLNETLNSNKYMFSMLDNLLSTYKYENGNVVINKQDINVVELIKSCCSELKHLAEDKNHSINFDFEDEILQAHIDPIEIKRVIMNLLGNAINYTDENGKILISAKEENDKIILMFSDNGKGIAKDQIPLIFSKFISYSKKFRQVGTGLGLYLAKKILERHDGFITVESEEGRGSCFTVSFPARKI